MTDEVNITQETLTSIQEHATNNLFRFLNVGTGSSPVTLTTQSAPGSVQVDTSNWNIASFDLTQNGSFFKIKYRLTAAMPNNLPVNLQSYALHKTVTGTGSATAAWTLPVSNEKDNNSQWTITISGRVRELERLTA